MIPQELRGSPTNVETKTKLVDTLKNTGIISAKWTGKIVISVTCGGINYIEKTETIK